MANAVKDKPTGRTNAQVCISFGEDDMDLLNLWDEDRKREHISRSSWVKNRIREQILN